MYGKRITDRTWSSASGCRSCSHTGQTPEGVGITAEARDRARCPSGCAGYESGACCPVSGMAGAGISLEPPCAVSSLAMVYSPYQSWQDIYEPQKGLCRGTIFAQLDKPWFPDSHC